MICARCGSEVPASSDRCAHCATSVEETVATGLLTPPPASSANDSDATAILDVNTELPTRVLSDRAGSDEAATVASGVGPPTRHAGPLEPGQAFGSRYHIIRALGVGGMGAVYQAWDAEL